MITSSLADPFATVTAAVTSLAAAPAAVVARLAPLMLLPAVEATSCMDMAGSPGRIVKTNLMAF